MTLHRVLEITNDSKNLSRVRGEAAAVLAETAFDREMRNKIIVAVDEALANVVEHAYGGGSGEVRVLFTLDERTLVVRIQDQGVRFDPGERLKTAVDIHEHIRLGLKGGLGMFLMRRIMDDVVYNHDGPDFVNELVMVKNLPQPDLPAEDGDASS